MIRLRWKIHLSCLEILTSVLSILKWIEWICSLYFWPWKVSCHIVGDCHQIFSSLRHGIAESLLFYLERKGKFSKFWPYILTLPKSHPTLLSEWPSKYVKHLPAVFRRNYWFRVRELGQRYDKINTFYHYYTNPANPNQVSMPGCTRFLTKI